MMRQPSSSGDRLWMLASLLFMLVVAFGLRWGTEISARGPVFDERWITRPMAELIRHGWTVDTAIDFQETKGPALIWPYAALGALMVDDHGELPTQAAPPGGRGGVTPASEVWYSPLPGGPDPAPPRMLNILRLVSMLWFALSVLPLLVLARWCGVRGPPLLMVAIFFALLPHEAIFGQLVMGEASFVLMSLLLVMTVVWGCGLIDQSSHRVVGPILFGLVLTVMLHSRPHAVAWAAGACLAVFCRDSWRSWPWWLAAILAGVLRVPLWMRWGGLVSSDFQNLHGMGLRLASLTYLLAAMTLMLGIFLLAAWTHPKWSSLRKWSVWGFGAGLFIAIIAPVIPMLPGELDLASTESRYQGFAATVSRAIGGEGLGGAVIIALLAGLGGGGLATLLGAAHQLPSHTPKGVLMRVQAWTLLFGGCFYILTRGFVFDRYLLAWAAVLPIVWILLLPRWAAALQAGVLSVVAVIMVRTWLM